jgi:hypothetical protein
MRKLTPFLFLGCILLVLASCQKEKSVDTLGATPGSGSNGGNGSGSNLPGTSNGSEIGTWNFIGAHCTTYQSSESNGFGGNTKVVTVSDYTTDNNTGTIQFDGSTMTASNLSYTMNSMATSYIYSANGVDTFSFPFSASIPNTSSTASYKKIVTDSIYVQSGVFTNLDPSGTGTVQGIASGYKLKWDGDKMYMSMSYQQTSNQVVMGITQKITIRVSSVTTLQKK